jgi:hypothetical protein
MDSSLLASKVSIIPLGNNVMFMDEQYASNAGAIAGHRGSCQVQEGHYKIDRQKNTQTSMRAGCLFI